MAKNIMIQGTMSNAGKSIISAGLCRIFKQDGYRVAPFKSQNMALNSYITEDNLEMGRAQAVQAMACGIEPSVLMNPILLKPTTDMGSQLILMGKASGNYSAKEYFKNKKQYIPIIKQAYDKLAASNDIVVIEGAGSPAEINLKQDDIVNMGMAELVDAPVLLVGDIDRGGVFAQLLGTIILLEEEEKARIKGLIVNKFRGDKNILEPGITMLEEKCDRRVIGVVPYAEVDIEDEDSLASCLLNKTSGKQLDIAIIRLPRISNFTDFQALSIKKEVNVRYVNKNSELRNPDMVIIPGTKSTISDMLWLRETGMEAAIKRLAGSGTLIFGICGGYQILGERIVDLNKNEGEITEVSGMGLLPVVTEFLDNKRTTQVSGNIHSIKGAFEGLAGCSVTGYEIHMGKTTLLDNACHAVDLQDGRDGCVCDNVMGSYIHGIFDDEMINSRLIDLLCERKGIKRDTYEEISYAEYRELQFDKLAEVLRANLDMDEIYRIMGL